MYRWAVANVAMGNYDGHAKNVGVVDVQAVLVRLAPAYDVVVTAVYPDLDQTFALSFGGTTHPRALTPERLAVAAREFRLTHARARELAADVVQRVRAEATMVPALASLTEPAFLPTSVREVHTLFRDDAPARRSAMSASGSIRRSTDRTRAPHVGTVRRDYGEREPVDPLLSERGGGGAVIDWRQW